MRCSSLFLPTLQLISMANPARANLRRPLECTQCAQSAALAASDAVADIELETESLDIHADLSQSPTQLNSRIYFSVRYLFRNTSAETRSTAIEFLAPRIEKPSIILNDQALEYCMRYSASNAKEAQRRLSPQSTPDESNSSKPLLNTISATLPLQPGVNRLHVEYQQLPNLLEGPHSYFKDFGLRGASFWFDYFLFPSESWKRSHAFRFDIDVRIINPVEKGWLWSNHIAPIVSSNIPLTATLDGESSRHRGSFPSFPRDHLRVTMKIPQ